MHPSWLLQLRRERSPIICCLSRWGSPLCVFIQIASVKWLIPGSPDWLSRSWPGGGMTLLHYLLEPRHFVCDALVLLLVLSLRKFRPLLSHPVLVGTYRWLSNMAGKEVVWFDDVEGL